MLFTKVPRLPLCKFATPTLKERKMPDLRSEIQKVIPVLEKGLQPKPMMEQVWLLLKDHPWWNSKRLAAVLKVDRKTVQNTLTNGMYRGMFVSRPSLAKGQGGKAKDWAIPPGMQHYELLPVLKEHESKFSGDYSQKKKVEMAQKQPNTTPFNESPRPPAPPSPPALAQAPRKGAMTDEELQQFVNNLPLADAMRIHTALKNLFKES
jgi:hypothetical protein